MESAILTWVVTVGLPVAAFFISIINKTKESERRITLVEEKQKNLDEKIKDYATRLTVVENNYKILFRVEEQLKTLFKQNEEIKEEVKSIKNGNN
ncbi:DUF7365 family protein [Mammaliicoccus sciuri]|uniref:DUF7365 family protein n=1 Tax=Mammaliicoccus sciuri TaxID=1296 RepID=UPI000D1EC4EE|nr:hypothetical protein [Mammaliicoccus sciuri]PTJ71227.1 hypothetical protein BU008_08630 [Mammaliicoccus sciuri]